MPLFLMVLAQAISAAPPERIDLTVPQPCSTERTRSNEIVVCANRSHELNPYRINQLPAPRGAQVPKAEVQLVQGVNVGAEAESAGVGGFPSKRAMLRLKIKF